MIGKHLLLTVLLGLSFSCTQSAPQTSNNNPAKVATTPEQLQQPASPSTTSTPTTTFQKGKMMPAREKTPEAKMLLEAAEMDVAGGKPPRGFPTDVPIYPGAKLEAGGRMAGDLMVTYRTEDRPSEVLQFYQNELQRRHWTVKPMKFAAGLLEAQKKGRVCTVTADQDMFSQDTLIGIVVTPEVALPPPKSKTAK
jgi:hypothetical protein